MFTRFAVVIQLSVAVASPALLLAQAPMAAPGSHVRLRTITGATVEGSLLTVGGDSVILGGEGGQIGVPRAAVQSLEIWHGRGSQWRSGAEIGWFTGFVTTFTVYAARLRNCIGYGCANIVKLNVYSATGGMAGALVGGLVGAAFGRDRWERLPLGPVHPEIVIGASDQGIGLSIRF
jgi:hypothetical protein